MVLPSKSEEDIEMTAILSNQQMDSLADAEDDDLNESVES